MKNEEVAAVMITIFIVITLVIVVCVYARNNSKQIDQLAAPHPKEKAELDSNDTTETEYTNDHGQTVIIVKFKKFNEWLNKNRGAYIVSIAPISQEGHEMTCAFMIVFMKEKRQ